MALSEIVSWLGGALAAALISAHLYAAPIQPLVKADEPITIQGGVCIDPDGAPVLCINVGGG